MILNIKNIFSISRSIVPKLNTLNPLSLNLTRQSIAMSHSQGFKITDWASKSGKFERKPSVFRNSISREEGAQYPPEANRYHLYVSLACPWAHRTLITRHLKGLTSIIGVSVVDWHLDAKGWRFSDLDTIEGPAKDKINGYSRLSEIYFSVNPEYAGRFTVPVLWDTKTNSIVNNESSEIIRMFYTEFDDLIDEKYKGLTFYPKEYQSKIDELNDWIYDNINNGVYKAGFATKQEAYDEAVTNVFSHLDKVEKILSNGGPYLLGKTFTEADLRLYPTIARFDAIYVQHFKCNIGTIRSNYPFIHKWLRHLYWEVPGFKETTDFVHIKNHYAKSHTQINPYSITPLGPIPNILPLDA